MTYGGIPYGGFLGGPSPLTIHPVSIVTFFEPPLVTDLPLGASLRVRFVILDAESGQAVDPPVLTLSYGPTTAALTTTTYGAPGSPIVRDNTGNYHVDLGPLTAAGLWRGTLVASGGDNGVSNFDFSVAAVR